MLEATQSTMQAGNDHVEKLITALGQRLKVQNEIMQAIAVSLTEIESHLRQLAISSNPAPNYQRLLSEYPAFDWATIGATNCASCDFTQVVSSVRTDREGSGRIANTPT